MCISSFHLSNPREVMPRKGDKLGKSETTPTRCDLSAAILFILVDSYLIAFKFVTNLALKQKNRGDKSHRVIVP